MKRISLLLFYVIGLIIFQQCDTPSSGLERNNPNDPDLESFVIQAPQFSGFEFYSDKSVKLTWTDTTSYIDGYILEKSLDGINFNLLDTVEYPTSEYIDDSKALTRDTQYSLKSFRKIETGLNVSDSAIYGIDFGTMLLVNSSYSPSPSQLNLSWEFTSSWPFIVEIVVFSGFDGVSYVDTLRNGETSFTYPFEQDFEERYLEARAYVFEEELLDTTENQMLTRIGTQYLTMDHLPDNFQVNVVNEMEVNMSWEDNSGIEEGFQILRSKKYLGSDPEVIATLPPNTTTYTDSDSPFTNAYSDFDGNRIVEYGVRAYIGDTHTGVFGYEAVLPYSQPPTLYENATTSSSIGLFWTQPNSNVPITSYILQRSVNNGPFSDYQTFDSSGNSYVDTDLQSENEYSYRVRSNASPYSNRIDFHQSIYLKLSRDMRIDNPGFFKLSDSGNLLVTSGIISGKTYMLIYNVNTGGRTKSYQVSGYEITNSDIDEERGRIAFTSNETNSLVVIDYVNDEIIAEENNFSNVYDLVFSPDGKFIYTVNMNSEVKKYDINSNSVVFTKALNSTTGGFRGITINPTGDKIAANYDGLFSIIDSSGTTVEQAGIDQGSVSNFISFSGSGNTLSYISHFNHAFAFDANSKERLFGASAQHISVNFDDRYAVIKNRDGVYLIDLQLQQSVSFLSSGANQIRFSPNSNKVMLLNSNSIQVWEISDDEKWIKDEQPNIYD